MAELGDIVMLGSGMRYTVLEWVTNHPQGGCYARLIRQNRDGSVSSFEKDREWLNVVESPAFELGEKVTVNGMKGGYLSTENGISRVLVAEQRKELRGGDFIVIDAHVERLPKARLVIENRRL